MYGSMNVKQNSMFVREKEEPHYPI